MAGYYTYYIDVYEEHLKQLFGIGSYKDVKSTKSAAIHHLEDSGLKYKKAIINVMHYNGNHYNDKNGPTIVIKPKK